MPDTKLERNPVPAKIWVSSPDGKKTEEHTPLNANDLVQNAGWVRTGDPNAKVDEEADAGNEKSDEGAENKGETPDNEPDDKPDNSLVANDASSEEKVENVPERDENDASDEKNVENVPNGNVEAKPKAAPRKRRQRG